MFSKRKKGAASLLLSMLSACAGDFVAPGQVDAGAKSPTAPSSLPTADKTAGSIIFFRKDWREPSFNPPIPVASVLQIVGMRQIIWAKVLTKSGTILEDANVIWTSSNPLVAAVAPAGICGPQTTSCNLTSIYAFQHGSAIVTATVGSVSASFSVTAYADPPETDRMNLTFSVVELGSPSGDDWSYAPLLRVTSHLELEIVAMRVTIPGAASISLCGASRRVEAEQQLDLFPEIYGDYALVAESRQRATGPALVTVYAKDVSGALFKANASGAIVPGGMPPTYTGVVIDEPWQVLC